jgi:DNA repair exonuclease SbcCD ATPase subunit
MADFESVAAQATVAISKIGQQIHALTQDVLAHGEYLEDVCEKMDHGLQGCVARLTAIQHDVSDAMESVDSRGAQFRQHIANVTSRVENWRQVLQDKYAHTNRQIVDCRTRLDSFEGELETHGGQAIGQVQALAGALDQSERDAQDLLLDCNSALDTAAQEVENELRALGDAFSGFEESITQTAVPDVANQIETAAEEVNQWISNYAEKLEDAREEIRDKADEVTGDMSQQLKDLGTGLRATIETLTTAMQELQTMVNTSGDEAIVIKETFVIAMEDTNLGLKTAVDILHDVKDIMEEVAG